MSDSSGPLSAARLAEQMGDALPGPESLPPSADELVARTRELVEAVVLTDVADDLRAEAARTLARVADTLRVEQREAPLWLVRHPDGRLESLLQAGSGRLNPQAPPIEWIERPAEPPAGAEPVPAQVRARCVFTAAHAGSPSRVHGGVLAAALDEVLGNAVTASGVSGLTVSLTVSFKGATPVDTSVELVGRYAGHEGRKSYATGEVLVGGAVVVEASAVYVAARREPPTDDRHAGHHEEER
ncbi:PaaI family thioesterase [Rhabdothermincola salaria]|uniref:PaaI family thioesterase n=1 Tax=Rhabdothermincola salaria TaxID=2903142 RepID=UPI001E336268|nr:PaaI family thioesterase [Rhabdothermincola salaria]MCD9624325.1 PaaI family thioesterase [Rhabdothermincola salaria]